MSFALLVFLVVLYGVQKFGANQSIYSGVTGFLKSDRRETQSFEGNAFQNPPTGLRIWVSGVSSLNP